MTDHHGHAEATVIPEGTTGAPIIGRPRLVFAPAPDRMLNAGLLLQLPQPHGWLRLKIDPDQIEDLHATLGSFLNQSNEEVSQLLDRVHGHTSPNPNNN